MPDGEHAFAGGVIDPPIGGIGEFYQWVRSRRETGAEGERHALVKNAGGIGGLAFQREIVGEIVAAVVARKSCCGGDRIFDSQDAIAGLNTTRCTDASSTAKFIP